MKPRFAMLLAVVALASGCATMPQNVKPQQVSAAIFDGSSREKLIAQQAQLVAELRAACERQIRARASDFMSVALVGFPVSSGGAVERIAALRGQLIALKEYANAAGYEIPKVDIEEVMRGEYEGRIKAKT